MLSPVDQEKLIAAQQSVDLAKQSLCELYKSDNVLLSEHVYELIDAVAKVNTKLERLILITKSSD